MATLYITEFQYLGSPGTPMQTPQVVLQPPVIEQTPLTISGVSAQSAAFNASTNVVRIHADTVCSILFGNNPTATTNNARLAAGQTEYFGVYPGTKVAVVANT